MKGVVGQAALDRTPDAFFELVSEGMRVPGWREAMWTHLNVAMSFGRARPEQVLSDADLRSVQPPVLFIWGDEDRYGGPDIGRRAAAFMSDARVEVVPGNHAPFLDDPERCAALIRQTTA
jgi:pimeloyl-ACP methyl ester carboxylesterase